MTSPLHLDVQGGTCTDRIDDSPTNVRAIRNDRTDVAPVDFLRTLGLFAATAVAEIVGCYLPYLWLRKGGPPWLLLPAAASLAVFVWLLTLHPQAAGRVYAGYGGVYVTVALLWLAFVDNVRLTFTDWLGIGLCLAGMGVIMAGSRSV